MGAVRVGEIAGHEDVLGPHVLEHRQDDRDVFLADGTLPDKPGPVEGEIQETRHVGRKPDVAQRRECLRLANHPLQLLHQLAVGVTGTFARELIFDRAAGPLDLLRLRLEQAGAPLHEIQVPPNITAMFPLVMYATTMSF